MAEIMYPSAREKRLLIEEFADETLVYDLENHQAHCLNSTAAFLWRRCDGQNSAIDLAAQLKREFGMARSEEVVRLALESLHEANRLQEDGESALLNGHASYSRRELVKEVGRLGLVIPAVLSIVSPLAAQAGSLISPSDCNASNLGRCCTNNKKCRQVGPNYKCNGPNC